MAVSLEGIPAELVSADMDAGAVSITLDAALYPLEALYGASYIFIDRCYLLMDKPDAGHFKVTLAPKRGAMDADALRALVGEFSNELLSCAWRSSITAENKTLIESVVSRAIAGAMGPPSFDELASFDFTETPFEDPLGIAQSWEEKYRKKDDDKAEEASAPAAPAPAAESSPAAPAPAPSEQT
jgi:His-Xaa-Ser system protein HxsD